MNTWTNNPEALKIPDGFEDQMKGMDAESLAGWLTHNGILSVRLFRTDTISAGQLAALIEWLEMERLAFGFGRIWENRMINLAQILYVLDLLISLLKKELETRWHGSKESGCYGTGHATCIFD